MIGYGALSMFAHLLDSSVARIGEIAADPRRFDRGRIIQLADIWDNNTFPLFAAAVTPTPFLRENRARGALRWMADFGEERRAWMTAECGPRMAKLLGPVVPRGPYSRDRQGHVFASVVPLDGVALAADYDLARAVVSAITVERAGDRLTGFLTMSVPRRYPVPGEVPDPTLRIYLDGLRDVEFSTACFSGVTVTGDEMTLGGRGRLGWTSATVGLFDDRCWYLSRAGQAADLIAPARNAREVRRPGQLRGTPMAALVFREAMLAIRTIRYSKRVGKVAVAELCGVLSGAGERMLAAADARRRGDGDAAFDRLVLDWIEGSPALADWLVHAFPEGIELRAVALANAIPRPPVVAPFPDPAAVLRAAGTSAQVNLLSWGDRGVSVNYTVPGGDGRWTLHSAVSSEPIDVSVAADDFRSLG